VIHSRRYRKHWQASIIAGKLAVFFDSSISGKIKKTQKLKIYSADCGSGLRSRILFPECMPGSQNRR